MSLVRRCLVLALVPALSACGNLQLAGVGEVPKPPAGATVRLTMERPTSEQVAPRAHAVPGRSIFVQQQGTGASLAGAGLYAIDPLQEAQAASGQVAAPAAIAAGPRSIALQPFTLLTVADDKAGIQTVVGLRVESHAGPEADASKRLIAIYGYVLRAKLPSSAVRQPLAPEALAVYRDAVRVGFSDLFRELAADIDRPAPKRQVATVRSDVFGGSALAGDVETNAAGRLTFRTAGSSLGPQAVPRPAYSVTVFPSRDQYSFDKAPAARNDPR
jgi:hypothetical protein